MAVCAPALEPVGNLRGANLTSSGGQRLERRNVCRRGLLVFARRHAQGGRNQRETFTRRDPELSNPSCIRGCRLLRLPMRRIPATGHERSVASPGFDDAVLFEFTKRSGNGVRGDTEVCGELAYRRQSGSRYEFAGSHQINDLGAHLFEGGYSRQRINDKNHYAALMRTDSVVSSGQSRKRK